MLPPPASSIVSHHTRAQPGRLNRRPVGKNATIRAITAKRTARALSLTRLAGGFWRDTLHGTQAKALLTQKRARAKLARTRSTLLQAYVIPWPKRP